MRIFFNLILLVTIIVLNNAELHRLQIHKHNGPFKTMGNILAEEIHNANKFNYALNYSVECANVDTVNSTFYSYIYIGTPPQKVKVGLETAFWVLIAPNSQYNSNLSSTSLQEFGDYLLVEPFGTDNYVYSDGESRDNVQIADLVIPGQVIYSFNGFKHGIFGLGLRAPATLLEAEPYPSPVHSLYNQKVLPENKFSMYLVADSDGVEPKYGGEVIFGGSDPTLYTGDLTYVDTVENTYNWAIELDAISMSGKTLRGKIQAVLDSGTDLIMCPILEYALINEKLNGTVDELGHYTVDCNAIDSFPTLEFTIAGKNITVAPSAYILKLFGSDGSIQCMSSIFYTIANNFVLGTPFMTQQYFEFDGFNSKVGFAPLVPYTGSTKPLPSVPRNILPKKVCKN